MNVTEPTRVTGNDVLLVMLEEHGRTILSVDPLSCDAREAWIQTAGLLIRALPHPLQQFGWRGRFADDVVRRCPILSLPCAYARLVAAERVWDLAG